MERKKVCLRIKKHVNDRIVLLAKEENRTIQEVYDELIELGYLEYLKGGIKGE